MKNKNIIAEIAIALLLLLSAAGIYIFSTQKVKAPMSQNSNQNRDQETVKYNFVKTGNIAKNNPGLKPNVWYLIYEKPGEPALDIELSFAPDAKCTREGISRSCDAIAFNQGDRVEVKGFVKDDSSGVLVRSMELVTLKR